MRVIVCGSRDWGDYRPIFQRLEQLPRGTVVVHGACSRRDRVTGREMSADALADFCARVLGLPVEQHPAAWRPGGAYNAWAGFDRNTRMAELGADLCLAFQRNGSRGTEHMIEMARAHGIPVEVFTA